MDYSRILGWFLVGIYCGRGQVELEIGKLDGNGERRERTGERRAAAHKMPSRVSMRIARNSTGFHSSDSFALATIATKEGDLIG
jgi:hypothetical protein